MNKNITIYCVCFPYHEPHKVQLYQQNIMCNAATISDEYRTILQNKNYVFDDSGDNISNLNGVLGDLTATYWIWKNSTCDIVGTSQYRRFWDNSIEKLDFKNDTLYVQEPVQLDNNIRNQYIGSHGEAGLEFLDELARNGDIVLTTAMLEKTYALRYLHSCNMFIAHKPVYDKFCEILFGIIFKLFHSYENEIKQLDAYNQRLPAFVAERVVMALIVNKDYFFPELKIEPLKWKAQKPSVLKKLFKGQKK